MEEAKNSLSDQIEKLIYEEDITGLDKLMQNLQEADVPEYKTELIDACLKFFHSWIDDMTFRRIKEDKKKHVVSDLFKILLILEKIDSEEVRYILKTRDYAYLDKVDADPVDKMLYIQSAVDDYTTAYQDEASAELNARWATALLNRMLITQQSADDGITAAFQLLKNVCDSWATNAFLTLLYSCFRIRSFAFSKNHLWCTPFTGKLEESLRHFAKKNPLIYLDWSNELVRILKKTDNTIPTANAEELNKQSIELLTFLTDYETNNEVDLCWLGSAFAAAAQRMEEDVSAPKLHYYEIALKYYLKAQTGRTDSWTAKYIAEIQMAMAHMYNSEHNQ